MTENASYEASDPTFDLAGPRSFHCAHLQGVWSSFKKVDFWPKMVKKGSFSNELFHRGVENAKKWSRPPSYTPLDTLIWFFGAKMHFLES